MHGLAPEYLKDLIDIKQNNTTYSLRSNDSSFKLNVPSIKTLKTLGDRCFMIAGCGTLYHKSSERRQMWTILRDV